MRPSLRARRLGLAPTSGAFILCLFARGAHASTSEDACVRVARLLDQGDAKAAQATIAAVVGPGENLPLTLRAARAVVGALLDDFAFLADFRQSASTADGDGCSPRGERRLQDRLRARVPAARARVRRAPDLTEVDRAAADLLLTWAAVRRGADTDAVAAMAEQASRFRRQFPDAAYEGFFNGLITGRWSEPNNAVETYLFGTVTGFQGQYGERVDGGFGGGFGAAGQRGLLRLGAQGWGGGSSLRQGFSDGGVTWSAGRTPTWGVVETTVGYRPTWGDLGALVSLGLGLAHMDIENGDDQSQLTFAHGSLSLGGDIARRASPHLLAEAGKRWLQVGFLVRAEVVLFGTLARAVDEGQSLAPAGLLFRVSVVGEDRYREAMVR